MVDIIWFFYSAQHKCFSHLQNLSHSIQRLPCLLLDHLNPLNLQLFNAFILLHAISIFPCNRIVIKFRNKARRRRKKHSTASHVSPLLLSCSGCFLPALQQNRTQSRLLYLFKVITRQLHLYMNSRKWRPSVKSFFFLITLLCVFRLLLRGQMGQPRLRQRKF